MRKLLLLAAAATVSVAAMAQGYRIVPAQGRIDVGPNQNKLGAKQISFFASGIELNPDAKGEFAIFVDGSETPAETKPATAATFDLFGGDAVSIIFDGTYNGVGEYRVLVPEGVFTVNGTPNEALDLKYYILKDYTVTPAPESIAESFSEWILEANDAEEIIVKFAPFIALNGSSEEYDLKYEIIEQEGVNPNRVRLYLDEPITTPGTWVIQIDEGAFQFVKYGPQHAENPDDKTVTTSFEDRIYYYVATTPKFGITPAEGVVDGLLNFTLTMPAGFERTHTDTMCPSYLYEVRNGVISDTPIATVKADSPSGTTLTIYDGWNKRTEPFTTPGEYVLRLGEGVFFGNFGGKSVTSSPYTYYYTIPVQIFDAQISPAAGSTLASLDNFELTFPNAEYMNVNEAVDAPKCVVKKDGAELTNKVTLAMEGGIVPYAEEGEAIKATLTIEPAIVDAGTYTIELPEGALMSGDTLSPAYSFTYICDGSLGIDGIDADTATYDVYTTTGICVLRAADASAVEALPAGLYIVNGRKQLIRK